MEKIRRVNKGDRINIILDVKKGVDTGYCPNSVAPEDGILIPSNTRNMNAVFIGEKELNRLGFVKRSVM